MAQNKQSINTKLKWLIGVLVIIIIGLIGYIVYSKSTKIELSNSSDAQLSQTLSTDKSTTNTITNQKSNTSTATDNTKNTISDKTVDWKTYTNTAFGFSFKYPKNNSIKDLTSLLKGNLEQPLWLNSNDEVISLRVIKGDINKAKSLFPQNGNSESINMGGISGEIYKEQNLGQEGSKSRCAFVQKGDYTFYFSFVTSSINPETSVASDYSEIPQLFLSNFQFIK